MNNAINFNVLEEKGRIVKVDLAREKKVRRQSESKKLSVLEKNCAKQINEYLLGKRDAFSVPIKYEGTTFQKRVWKQMQKIPCGKTISYKKLAVKIGNPKAYRAVANACGKNPLPIIIPCHRVVASNGLGGYSAGIEIKKKLLQIEQEYK